MSSAGPIRDPIHGFISVEGRENEVLGCSLFQRLRRIHQLAMARLVYPGALHTRFDHTLGVLHVASRLCKVLEVDDHHTKIIRFAALLHDVGHGPFSHVSEDVLQALSPQRPFDGAGKKEKIHELITRAVILTHPDLGAALSGSDREEIADLLNDGLEDQLHRDIISGPLDADKQDYLLRDSYFCGVQYGVYDIDQLHLSLCAQDDGDERLLMVKETGVHAVEQYVLAKYYLTTQVYKHKVRLITDHMLIRALVLGAKKDRLDWLERLYRYPDETDPISKPVQDFITEYLQWDDQRITVELLKPDHENTHAGRLFRFLVERRLFKRVFSVRTRDLPPVVKTGLQQRFPEIRAELEAVLAEILSGLLSRSVPPEHVILNHFKIDSVRTQSRNDEASILIAQGPSAVPFEQESVLFQSINEGLRDEFLEAYAPLGNLEDKEKRKLKEKAKTDFLNVLDRKFNHATTSKTPEKP